MVGSPLSDVVLRLVLIPTNHVEFLCPTLGVFRKNADMFCDFVLEFCHDKSPLILGDTAKTEPDGFRRSALILLIAFSIIS